MVDAKDLIEAEFIAWLDKRYSDWPPKTGCDDGMEAAFRAAYGIGKDAGWDIGYEEGYKDGRDA
jgi:flagellar biosynthesis/type III secretory pathway protein FliH